MNSMCNEAQFTRQTVMQRRCEEAPIKTTGHIAIKFREQTIENAIHEALYWLRNGVPEMAIQSLEATL